MARKPAKSVTPAIETYVQVETYAQKADAPAAITPIEYSGLQEAFDHFNAALFTGELPDVFMTYQRKANSHGYFAADRFTARDGQFRKHELALNPDAFIGQSDAQVCQTLVHEQVHVWQHAFGKPSGRGYHNAEWAAKMKAVGLQPSSTGMVGGKETGQRMSHYVIPEGPFMQAFAKLAATGWKLNLQSAHRLARRAERRARLRSPARAAVKTPGASPISIICELCGVKMRPADSEQLAAGGIAALAARHDAGAVKLLGQMR